MLLVLCARIKQGTGFSPVTLAFRETASLQEQADGSFRLNIPDKPPLKPTPSLTHWRKQAKEAEKKRVAGQTQHLKVCYKMDDKVYVQNPRKTKLAPDYLSPFVVRSVHENHNYTFEDAVGN